MFISVFMSISASNHTRVTIRYIVSYKCIHYTTATVIQKVHKFEYKLASARSWVSYWLWFNCFIAHNYLIAILFVYTIRFVYKFELNNSFRLEKLISKKSMDKLFKNNKKTLCSRRSNNIFFYHTHNKDFIWWAHVKAIILLKLLLSMKSIIK